MDYPDELPGDGDRHPFFSAEEARVAACLMEKELITPDNYPLSVHALALACNQKSSREPVMHLSEGEVGHIVNRLAERDLARIDYGGRAPRVSHRLHRALHLDRRQQAILTVLMLRFPQTLNDIRTRTARMTDFADLDAVRAVVDELAAREPPLAIHLPKGPGQREDRYTHLLCGESFPVAKPEPLGSPRAESGEDRDARIDDLEARVAALEAQIAEMLEGRGNRD